MKTLFKIIIFILIPLFSSAREKLFFAKVKLDTRAITNVKIFLMKDDSVFAETYADTSGKFLIYLQDEKTGRRKIRIDSIKHDQTNKEE